jgi:D-methionine transport system substrate-binding protein
MLIKNIFKALLLTLTLTALTACGEKASSENEIKIGTISGPETQLMEVAKEVAADNGLKLDIVTFTDYAMPNEALADGSIDANMFQHQPYLDQAVEARGYDLVVIGKTFVYPMGIYSKKINSLNELKDGSSVAIPKDPSNQGRALLLLQELDLITLESDAGTHATVLNITANPKNLQFTELDAGQLPRTLPDVDIAAINTNYAMLAGLLPSRDALAIESSKSPYANLVVVREGDEDDPKYQKLMDALHSDKVLEEADVLFKGQAIPAWK